MLGMLSVGVLGATALAGVSVHYAQGAVAQIRTVPNDPNFSAASVEETRRLAPGAPINILVMGSDSREGRSGSGTGGSNPELLGSQRSDTTMLVHISGDRQRALAVSIPRDSMVSIPSCTTASGYTTSPKFTLFNEAFNSGPGCTAKTVTALTGVTIDHYIVVNFAGFQDVVDALDGVEICLTKPVNDPGRVGGGSGINLPAGKQTIRGKQALAFVRERDYLGDGSDLSRIGRQQDFVSSAIRKATSAGVLTNPGQLLNVLTATTKSLTTDPGLANLEALQDLAVNTSELSPDKIVFATVPWMQYAPDPNRIAWVPSQAQQLWDSMIDDTAWPPAGTSDSSGKPLYTAASGVTVDVMNATGVNGKGLTAGTLLRSEGYQVPLIDSTKKPAAASYITYDASDTEQTEAARTLSYATGAELSALPSRSKQTPGSSSITLYVAADFPTELKPVVTSRSPDAPSAPAKPRTATESICAS